MGGGGWFYVPKVCLFACGLHVCSIERRMIVQPSSLLVKFYVSSASLNFKVLYPETHCCIIIIFWVVSFRYGHRRVDGGVIHLNGNGIRVLPAVWSVSSPLVYSMSVHPWNDDQCHPGHVSHLKRGVNMRLKMIHPWPNK
jgi:hypothetical protein